MARNYLAASLLIGLALVACGKKDKAGDEPAVNLADLRARRDSIARARVRDDSIALAVFTTCSDSATTALKKTSAGRRSLATRRPAGTMVPEVLAACGTNPSQRVPGTSLARTDSVMPSAMVPDTTKQATPPAATPIPPVTTPAGMTPQQRQVARADSIRKVREQAHADSLRRAAEKAHTDSLTRLAADSAHTDSLRQSRETEVLRETFSYGGGSRDPFFSLVDLPTQGPEFIDLQLVAVYQDLRYGGNSIAVVRDKKGNKRYNVRVGDRIGRMKVAQIRQRDVVFTIEDLGFERQETLSLRKREEQTP
ncbi:MAG: hypothetical protein ABI836_05515 [Gemmatimonadota bacterium]